jgi:hypothetical protein
MMPASRIHDHAFAIAPVARGLRSGSGWGAVFAP